MPKVAREQVHQKAAIAGLLAWMLMVISFIPMLLLYGVFPAAAVLMPLIALFYAAATVHSAWMHWRGRGASWKGRLIGK